jgi:hypothetical protein
VLGDKREKELKEHEKYRDSVMRRFAFKVGGKTDKFEARAAKEEREYFDVLREEHRAREQEATLRSLREEADRAHAELEAQAARHAQAQRDLDGLYDSIFQGATPDFPEEDDKERLSGGALQAYHDARVQAETEGQAVRSLEEAAKHLAQAMSYMEEALSCSRMDMFGGGTMTDMMERSALQQAEMLVNNAYWMVEQARRQSPAVGGLPPVHIAKGSIMSDVFFDNIFTDMDFHDKIKASRKELEASTKTLEGQLGAAKHRQQQLESEAGIKSTALEASRVELQRARERIFERMVGK